MWGSGAAGALAHNPVWDLGAPGSHELSSEFLAGERLQRPRRWQVRLPHPVAVELRVSRAPHRLQLQRSSMRRVTGAVSIARARVPPVSERRGVASCGFRKRSKYSKDIRCPSVRPLLGSLLLPARRGCSSHDSSPRLRDRASRGFRGRAETLAGGTLQRALLLCRQAQKQGDSEQARGCCLKEF